MAKSKKIALSIPEPCNQEWDKMTPHEKGKFCERCNKAITDFSNFTDKELVDYISNAQNKVCGKFNNQQLNRTLSAYQPSDTSIFRRILLGGALTAGIAGVAQGQNTTLQQTTQQVPAQNNENKTSTVATPSSDTSHFIKGIIIDDTTQAPVAYAAVVLEDSDKQIIGAMSDLAGTFILNIPNEYVDKPLTLLVEAEGYYDLKVRDIFYKHTTTEMPVYHFKMTPSLVSMTIGILISTSPDNSFHQDLTNPDETTYRKDDFH